MIMDLDEDYNSEQSDYSERRILGMCTQILREIFHQYFRSKICNVTIM